MTSTEVKMKLIDEYAKQKVHERGLSEIRKELLDNGISEDEVRGLMIAIDRNVHSIERQRNAARKSKEFFWYGIVAISVSVIVGIASLLGFFGDNYYFVYFMVPGLIGGGASMAGGSYFKRNY